MDQYADIQQNLNQEYINLTRGITKTCMWVEMEPFGHPGPRESKPACRGGGFYSPQCSNYARKRNEHIMKENLPWRLLEESEDGNLASSYHRCFNNRPDDKLRRIAQETAKNVWSKLD